MWKQIKWHTLATLQIRNSSHDPKKFFNAIITWQTKTTFQLYICMVHISWIYIASKLQLQACMLRQRLLSAAESNHCIISVTDISANSVILLDYTHNHHMVCWLNCHEISWYVHFYHPCIAGPLISYSLVELHVICIPCQEFKNFYPRMKQKI